jgi:predicted SnoaL-like aldol condensation-catalyzing enzyme
MTPTKTTVGDRLVEAMENADWDAVTDTYAADVLLDMNLPMWRFQLQGRDAAREYFRDQVSRFTNLRLTHQAVHHTDTGLIIEEEMRFDGDDGEYLWRAVDIFRIDEDTVTEHAQYCTGCWTPEQIDRQATEAPMVRW